MEHEAEVAGTASAGSLSSGANFPVQSGEPCANCVEIVPHRFCSTCGQLASDFHRRFWELITGSLGDMFALDGRLFRSLPMLMFRPGRITRSYLDGERARYVPPFRMFLLASVVFFLTVFTLGDEFGWFDGWTFDPNPNGGFLLGAPDSDARADLGDLSAQLDKANIDPQTREIIAESVADGVEAPPFAELLQPDGKIDRVRLRAFVEGRMEATADPAAIEAAYRAATVYEDQNRFGARLRQWITGSMTCF